MANAAATDFKLVSYSNFVRNNPRTDRFSVLGFHHVEFWVTDATSAAGRFSFGLGMPLAARSDLSTGNHLFASYLLRSSSLRFLFSAPYGPCAASGSVGAAYNSPIPSFDPEAARRFSAAHGLAVRAIALEVADASEAFRISVAHGARPAFPPADLRGGFAMSEVELYGDVILRYLSRPKTSGGTPDFLPGFEDLNYSDTFSLDYGLRRLDHVVGNVVDLSAEVKYLADLTGFHEFCQFMAEDLGKSGVNTIGLANNEETVLMLLNEPVHGTKRRSQIQTSLDHNCGAGLHHLALATNDIMLTLREMKARSQMGGFEFMPPPPAKYYEVVRRRAGDVLTEEKIRECKELGVLVDRDDEGVLLQIFTKPVGDRPTMFLEIIQRIGCMEMDEEGREHQKSGCGGFGEGNIIELIKCVEEYEKSLKLSA